MSDARRKHSREFKIEAVKQVTEQGRSLTEVANDLGVHASMVARWRDKYESAGAGAFPGNKKPGPERDEEMRQLRRELELAQKERDILKKALAYFAKDKD